MTRTILAFVFLMNIACPYPLFAQSASPGEQSRNIDISGFVSKTDSGSLSSSGVFGGNAAKGEETGREKDDAGENVESEKKPPDGKTFSSLPMSDFEKYVNDSLPENFPAKIKQFGYSLFLKSPSTFAPVADAPAVSDYVIVPGDEIRINIWGKIEGSWDVVVGRDGNIILPKIGVFRAAGFSFDDFRKNLKAEFSKYYSRFNFSVSLGALKGITVYVVGNARKPGSYTVSSLSTLISALFATGGPDKSGSLRAIELKRGGKTVKVVDLYDFLLKGDKSADARLLPGDVIYIPPAGPMAAVIGSVKKPAIYELKGGEKVMDLVRMAGGFTNTAFRGRAAVKRIYAHKFSDFFEGNLSLREKDKAADFPVLDGDIIRFYPITESDSSVQVEGAVYYPGKFGFNRGFSVRDIVSLAGGLLPESSDAAELTRMRLTKNGPEYMRYELNIKKALLGDEENNLKLEPNDYLFIKKIPGWRLYKTVEIRGEVKYPGKYSVLEGEKLSDLLERAGGFTREAYPRGLVFTRERVKEIQQKNLEKIASRLERQLIVESSNKMQTFLSQEDLQSKKAAFEAKKKFVENIRNLKATGRLSLKIKKDGRIKGSSADIVLENGDEIYVPPRPSVVSVTGAVMTEGSFVYSKGCSWKKYISKAGGYSTYADKGKTFILKVDGSAVKPSDFLFFSTKVEPGDTIVVPEKFTRIAWFREIRDITQILMQIALTTGVVIKVF